MKNILFSALTILIASCLSTPLAHRSFEQAISQLEAGDTISAIRNLEQTINQDSTIWEAYHNLGSIYLNRQDTALCVQNYQLALIKSDNSAIVGKSLIDAYQKFGMLEKSLDLSYSMVEKYPDNIDFRIQKIISNVAMGELNQLDSTAIAYMRASPNGVYALEKIAWVYCNSQEHEKSITYYSMALEMDSIYGRGKIDRDAAYFNQSISLGAIGKESQALQSLNKIDPQSTIYINALEYRIQINSLLGYYDKVKEDLKALLALNPDHSKAASTLSSLEEYQSRPEYTIIDTSPEKYSAEKYSTSLVLARSRDDKYGYLRYNNETKKHDIIAVPFKYENAFPEKVFAKTRYTGFIAVSNGVKWALIGANLTLLTPFKYDNVWIDFKNKQYAKVNIGSKYGIVSQLGEVGTPKYDGVGFDKSMYDDLLIIPVHVGGKCGYINIYGDQIISLKYRDVSYFSGSWPVLAISVDGYIYYVDEYGNEKPVHNSEHYSMLLSNWAFHEWE